MVNGSTDIKKNTLLDIYLILVICNGVVGIISSFFSFKNAPSVEPPLYINLFEWYSYVIFLFSIYALIKFKKLKLPRVITFLPIFEIVTPILVIILSIITFLGIGAPIESLIQTPLHLIIISFMVASIEIVYPIIIFSKKDSIGGGEEPLMNKTAIKPNKRNYLKFGALLLIISIIAFLLMPLFIVDIVFLTH